MSLVMVLVALLALTTGCGTSGDADVPSAEAAAAGGAGATTVPAITTTAATPSPRGGTASAGCGAGGALPAAGMTREQLRSGGSLRDYRRFVPTGYTAETPTPLVVDIHGLTMNDDLEALVTGMEDLADDEGFLVATPRGLGTIPHWNYVSDAPSGDIAFIADLVERVGEDLCVDTSRVYATGISNGGLMSSGLACRLPDVFAAVAPVAGVAFFPGCADGPPVSYQATYGTADSVLPYAGGLGAGLRGFLAGNALDAPADASGEPAGEIGDTAFPPVDRSMARWAARNGCAEEPDDERVSDEVTRRSWPGCDGGAEVVLYLVEGGGHSWPGTPLARGQDATGGFASSAGHTTQDISATELAWEFFQRHQLDP